MKNLFTSSIPELDKLPEDPKTFWYVSAGKDFRSLVFLTNYNIDRMKKHCGKEFVKPDLFLFNGMGREVSHLRFQLRRNKETVLYNDRDTVLIAKNFKELGLNKEHKDYIINPANINLNSIRQFPKEGKEAFYFEVEVIGKSRHNYVETQKVLYIEHENIDVFDKIVLDGPFDVKYMCATREGMAWGGCNKSIVEHIYGGDNQEFYMNRWFGPEFNILFNDFTSDLFENKTLNSDLINFEKDYHYYLPEDRMPDSFWKDSVIYRLKYDFQSINNYEKLAGERIDKLINEL